MKNIKLPIYIFIELLLILIARLVFINTGKIAQFVSGSETGSLIAPIVNNLYILQSLLIFIPFLVVIVLIFRELAIMNHEKKERIRLSMQESEIIETEEEENTEEKLKLQQELLLNEIEDKRQRLLKCIDEVFKTQKKKDSKSTSELLLGCISKIYEITQAEIFLKTKEEGNEKLVLSATYAFYVPDEKIFEFEVGEGLIGQVAKAGEPLYMSELPQGYITVKSGLGESTPSHLAIIPWKSKEGDTFAVLEMASFKAFDNLDIDLLMSISEKIREFYA